MMDRDILTCALLPVFVVIGLSEGWKCMHDCTCRLKWYPTLNRTLNTLDCYNVDLRAIPRLSDDGRITGCLLRGNDFSSIDSIAALGTYKHVIALVLTHNKMNSMHKWPLVSDRMQLLRLDGNQFDYLPRNAFKDVPNLSILSLSHNSIESLHKEAFAGLDNLRHLNISANRLANVNGVALRNLSQLEVLDLTGNLIKDLAGGQFRTLSKLRRVYLGGNDIHYIHEGAFAGLHKLEVLNLEKNHIKAVPTAALQIFHLLSEIRLSSNHLSRFRPGSFERINVTNLHVDNLDDLVLVDNGAFVNMPHLRSLAMHNNKRLSYIDVDAFSRTPKLKSLSLHGNNLKAIEYKMIRHMPNLDTISFHDNPLHCDCSIFWIVADIFKRHRFTFIRLEDAVCRSPKLSEGTLVYRHNPKFIQRQCSPTIIPLFEKRVNVLVGNNFTIDCRAVGVPAARLSWIDPSGHVHKNMSHFENKAVSPSGTLMFDRMRASDQGIYTCAAENGIGDDRRRVLVVTNKIHATLLVLGIKATSVTVTWKGTTSLLSYVIIVEGESTLPRKSRQIHIRPYMREYTVSNLQPLHQYRVCIAVLRKSATDKARYSRCIQLTTKSIGYLTSGVFNFRKYVLGGVFGVLVVAALVVVSGLFVYRKYRRRRRLLKELYGDNLSQLFFSSVDSSSGMTTPVTYENVTAQAYEDEDSGDDVASTSNLQLS